MVLNTPRGAQSSAILYSIAETAQTNNLKPYEYFRFLLDEIAEHLYGREHDPNDHAFLNDLLPWSDKLPDICKKRKFEVCWSRVWLQFYFCLTAVVDRLPKK